jgi:glycosyltransferase involved in cell wall biosynthesis
MEEHLMKVCFIPNLGVKRSADEPKWGADLFAEAFQKYIPYNVTIEYSLNNIKDYDLVWIHNVANLLKGFRGRIITFKKLIQDHPPMIGGVRGEIGFKAAKMYLRYFNAIHTSNDRLTRMVKSHNSQAFTLCSGVDPDWYTPRVQPEGFCIGWAGDTTKNMKNTELIAGLLIPTRWATKENYIPNHEMPQRFYQKINVLVHPSSHEGSCRVITEAAACGLPIICTDVGHNSSIVDPEWMITLDNNPKAQIKALLNKLKADPILARKVGMQNQKRALNYTWPRVIERAKCIIDPIMVRD